MKIGDRRNEVHSHSNFGWSFHKHTREIGSRTYEFTRKTRKDGLTELWVTPVGTQSGSRHLIRIYQ